MHPSIQQFAMSRFPDRDAADFVGKWLSCFYGNDSITKTLSAQVQIFSGFGGNRFFAQHYSLLYPLCANSLMCFAEGAALLANKDQANSGIMALMQGIEPAITAARLSGQDAGKFRIEISTLIDSLSPGA